MTQFRKLSIKNLEVGNTYIAYSARNKLLSSNSNKGVFVKLVSVSGENIKVQVLGTTKETAINKLDTRTDAWLYDPSGSEIQVQARIADKAAWPGFSQRMENEGWDGKTFTFNEEEIHVIGEDDGRPEYVGLATLRHEGETIDPEEDSPYVNIFLMSNIYPVEPPEWRTPRAQRMGIGAIELPLPPKPVAEEHNAIITLLSPLVRQLRKDHKEQNVSYGKTNADASEKRMYIAQQCHRSMTSDEAFDVHYVLTIGRNDVKVGTSGGWNKGHASEEAEIFWITYLVGYSPYKDVFVTKDIDFIRKHGYILDAKQPNRLLVGACYATRQIWEKSPRLEAFLAMYKAGVPIDQAFVFGCQCSEFKDGKMKFSQNGETHSHLYNAKLSDKCILAFLDHKPAYPGKPYIESCRTTDDGKQVDSMWSKDFGQKVSPMFKKLNDIKGAGSWGSALAIDEAIERAADAIDEWSGRMGV